MFVNNSHLGAEARRDPTHLLLDEPMTNWPSFYMDKTFLAMMTSKVRVEMPICSHKTLIDADALDDGTVKVRIRSTCKDVRDFAKRLGPLGPEDYVEIRGSKIFQSAIDARLTPTCLVPTAVFNVVWMEVGMISKSLALKEKAICVHFEG